MNTFCLKLYINGKGDRSQLAIDNIQQICEEQVPGQYELAIIDINEHPELAEEDSITITPTLIRMFSDETMRVVGDLSQTETVIKALHLYLD